MLVSYNENPKESPATEKLYNLSPLSKEIIYSSLKVLKKGYHLIIAYPDYILAPLSIFCVDFAVEHLKSPKDVYVFTYDNHSSIENNPLKFHLRNFSFLAYGTTFSHYHLLPCLYSEKEKLLSLNINLKLAWKRSTKTELKEWFEENLLNHKKPLLVLNRSNNFLFPDIFNNVEVNKKKYEAKIKPNVGLVIFENLDRLVYNSYTYERFIEWIAPFMKQDIQFIFHFSNPYNEYLNHLKDYTESLAFHVGSSFIKQNAEYFRHVSSDEIKGSKLVKRYNIDNEETYRSAYQIIPLNPIQSFDIDKRISDIQKILRNLNFDNVPINRKNLFRLRRIIFSLRNLSVRPSLMKYIYYEEENDDYFYVTMNEFIERLYNKIKDMEDKTIISLLSEVKSITDDLSKTKIFDDAYSSGTLTKNFAILDFTVKLIKYRLNLLEFEEYPSFSEYLTERFDKVKQLTDKQSQYKVVIAVQNTYEKRILFEEIQNFAMKSSENFNIAEKIEIFALKHLVKRKFLSYSYDLILSGPLPIRFFSEYFRGFDNIFILSYEGSNHESCLEHMEIIDTISPQDERKSLELICELKQLTSSPDPDYIKDYKSRREQISLKEFLKTGTTADRYQKIRDMVFGSTKFLSSKQEEEENEELEEIEKASSEQYEDEDYDYRLVLNPVESTSERTKTILVKDSWTFLYIRDKNTMKMEEGYVADINETDFIILLEKNERRSFFEFIIETFDLEEGVDIELINSWKDALVSYLNRNQIDPQALYKKYQELCKENNCKPKTFVTFRNWLKGNVIGTRDAEDLFFIGKIIDNENLTEQYNRIHDEIRTVWVIRQQVGKKMNIIIKEILEGRINEKQISFEDSIILEKIQIYELVEKIKITKNEK